MRSRRGKGALAVAIVILAALLIPIGTFDPYPGARVVQRRVAACTVMPAARLAKVTGGSITTEDTQLKRDPNYQPEQLAPSVSYDQCRYTIHGSCTSGGGVLRASEIRFQLIVLSNNTSASTRFNTARIAYANDPVGYSNFHNLSLGNRPAYGLVASAQVLDVTQRANDVAALVEEPCSKGDWQNKEVQLLRVASGLINWRHASIRLAQP